MRRWVMWIKMGEMNKTAVTALHYEIVNNKQR